MSDTRLNAGGNSKIMAIDVVHAVNQIAKRINRAAGGTGLVQRAQRDDGIALDTQLNDHRAVLKEGWPSVGQCRVRIVVPVNPIVDMKAFIG